MIYLSNRTSWFLFLAPTFVNMLRGPRGVQGMNKLQVMNTFVIHIVHEMASIPFTVKV